MSRLRAVSRRLATVLIVADLLLTASTLAYIPTALYGTAGSDDPLSTQQVITFAPLTSTPFYAALRDSVAHYGCTAPQSWKLKHGNSYPVTMIVQDVTPSGEPTWHLSAKPWSFKNVGGYVRLLCPEMKARIR